MFFPSTLFECKRKENKKHSQNQKHKNVAWNGKQRPTTEVPGCLLLPRSPTERIKPHRAGIKSQSQNTGKFFVKSKFP